MLSYVDIEAFDPTKQHTTAKQTNKRHKKQGRHLIAASHQRQQQASAPQQADAIQTHSPSLRQAQ